MATTDAHRPPARLRDTPSWLITQIAIHAARLSGEAFNATGCRRYQYALLAALEEFGPASQAELGRRCSIDRSYVVEAVNDLADRGLAVRIPDPADRRRNIITITETGEREFHRIGGELDKAQDELLAPLSPDEREQLTRLMARVLDHQTRR
ncbi:MarR family winged helix-turn-helix transcriptional regulator [Actinocorallia sp. B10E7]|uniref:MarR family winged helix-turn-helix transcriptional regulator n=1 Tax=Actinocorallia sp. B10E7 TaxID=3153558 RepID=UPI00325DF0E8